MQAMGKCRIMPTFKVRYGKGMRGLARSRGLAKVTPEAKRLALSGGKAQMSWGHQAKGMSPTTLRAAKWSMAKAGYLYTSPSPPN